MSKEIKFKELETICVVCRKPADETNAHKGIPEEEGYPIT